MCIWVPIKCYEGIYEISSEGEVRNTKTKHILKPQPDRRGYLTVNLYKNKKMKTKKIHRLVAIAFIPNPNNLPQVNHKDTDITNNSCNNLEWCTCAYNIEYSQAASGRILSPEGEIVSLYNIRKFARNHGLNQSALCGVLSGRLKQHKGWRLA